MAMQVIALRFDFKHSGSGLASFASILWAAPGDNWNSRRRGLVLVRTFIAMLDINGDGLPDHVEKTTSNGGIL
jgi:hypothetical protein